MKYFLMKDIVYHNKSYDFWVVIHGDVLDLTSITRRCAKNGSDCVEYLLTLGGRDISKLFDKNGEPIGEAATEMGRDLLHLLPMATNDLCKSWGDIWSVNQDYRIGRITRRPRQLRVMNTVSRTLNIMEVCDEDTISDIQLKYDKRFTYFPIDYVWKKFLSFKYGYGKLMLNGTLDDNGLFDRKIDGKKTPPTVWLYCK